MIAPNDQQTMFCMPTVPPTGAKYTPFPAAQAQDCDPGLRVWDVWREWALTNSTGVWVGTLVCAEHSTAWGSDASRRNYHKKQNNEQNVTWKSSHSLNASLRVSGIILQDKAFLSLCLMKDCFFLKYRNWTKLFFFSSRSWRLKIMWCFSGQIHLFKHVNFSLSKEP